MPDRVVGPGGVDHGEVAAIDGAVDEAPDDGDVALLVGRDGVGRAEVLGDHPQRLAGDLDGLGVREAVVDAGELLVGDLHALALEVGGEVVHLVAQRVELGGHHERGRELAEPRVVGRRHERVAEVGAGEVGVPHELDQRRRDDRPGLGAGALLVGPRDVAHAELGADGDGEVAAGVDRLLDDGERDLAARAGPADRDALAVPAEALAVLVHPDERVVGLLLGHRMAHGRRGVEVGDDDVDAELRREVARDVVLLLRHADDEPAAMGDEVHGRAAFGG